MTERSPSMPNAPGRQMRNDSLIFDTFDTCSVERNLLFVNKISYSIIILNRTKPLPDK
jgi:hypothetical protein